MGAQKPNLPVSLRVLSFVEDLMIALDLPITRLDEDSVCAYATKEAGLSDFGDPYFRDGLRKLLESCEVDANLHPLGHLMTRDIITSFLIQRLKLAEARKQKPEIFDQPLIPPLIVTGMARSGTTFLQNLLAVDPAHRSIPQWKLMRPFPEKDTQQDAPDPRKTKMEQAIKMRQPLLPGIDSKHYTRADSPEECIVALGLTFNSLFFPTILPVSGYMEWYLNEADSSQKYQEYRWLLQVYQSEESEKRLAMKAPAHMGSLVSLKKNIPEAMIVQLHRDPVTCVSSACSLISTFHRGVSNNVDVEGMADLCMLLYETWLKRNLRFRKLFPNVIYDVTYDSFVTDPLGTIRQIYSHFNLPWTDTVAQNLREHIDSHPKNKHGKHRYSASDFGLSEAEIADRLKFFYGEYITL